MNIYVYFHRLFKFYFAHWVHSRGERCFKHFHYSPNGKTFLLQNLYSVWCVYSILKTHRIFSKFFSRSLPVFGWRKDQNTIWYIFRKCVMFGFILPLSNNIAICVSTSATTTTIAKNVIFVAYLLQHAVSPRKKVKKGKKITKATAQENTVEVLFSGCDMV